MKSLFDWLCSLSIKNIVWAMAVILVSAQLAHAKQKTVIVAIESNDYYPHYQMMDKEPIGFAGDLFRAFARDTGLNLEFQSVPLKRILLEMPRGDIDLKYPDNRKWNQRAKAGRFFYSSPVVRYLDGVMVLPGNLGRPRNLIREMGTLYGFTPWPWMDRIKKGDVKVVEIISLKGLIRRMGMNGFDGIYANIDVARYIMNEQLKEPNLLVFDRDLPFADSYYAASTVTNRDVLALFDDWQRGAVDLKRQLEKKYQIGMQGVLGTRVKTQAK